MFETDIFSPHSSQTYRDTIQQTVESMLAALPTRPYRGGLPDDIGALLPRVMCPPSGRPLAEVLTDLQAIVGGSVAVWHPYTAAHLHTPVLIPALAAELVLTALNPSMDSFDQAPTATLIELALLRWLCELAGLPSTADGTFTSGGTQSNYMALWLARDHYLTTRRNGPVREKGLPPDSNRLRILCSEVAHFSVEKSAMQLGLGTQAVVKIEVDEHFQMRPDRLAETVTQLKQAGLEPFALVATAGTTDFGSLDPLESVAVIAAESDLWLHVDAAYGGALLLSEKHKAKLTGLNRADSVTMDFHKAFFQPISCGAFLLADARRFDLIRLYADYLNPESHEQAGIPDLVSRSVLTTRRFDALKLWMSLQMIGLDKFGRMVERLCELAELIAEQISASPDFELLHRPQFGCVVFRYLPFDRSLTESINQNIPLQAFTDGAAVIGHTVVKGKACLKLTLNNPAVEQNQLTVLLDMIRNYGRKMENSS